MSQIQMVHPRGQTPSNIFPDFEWIKAYQGELISQYGEVSILVHQQQVIGVGEHYAEALAAAENNPLLPSDSVITPMHYHLARNPFQLGLSLKAADE